MLKQKKKTNYDASEIVNQIVEAVTDAYLNPAEDTADENGHMYLNLLAEKFSMTPIKIRKLLITSGAYETSMSRQVNELYNSGKSVKEIQTIMELSSASVNGYLPYKKAVYNLEEVTLTAERVRKYRKRKDAVCELAMALNNGNLERIKETLWNALIIFERYPFKTAKGLRYYYTIKGNEIFFSRKEKSVTKASMFMALETAIEFRPVSFLQKSLRKRKLYRPRRVQFISARFARSSLPCNAFCSRQ